MFNKKYFLCLKENFLINEICKWIGFTKTNKTFKNITNLNKLILKNLKLIFMNLFI